MLSVNNLAIDLPIVAFTGKDEEGVNARDLCTLWHPGDPRLLDENLEKSHLKLPTVFIPSKNRSDQKRASWHLFLSCNVPFAVVVEPQEAAQYRRALAVACQSVVDEASAEYAKKIATLYNVAVDIDEVKQHLAEFLEKTYTIEVLPKDNQGVSYVRNYILHDLAPSGSKGQEQEETVASGINGVEVVDKDDTWFWIVDDDIAKFVYRPDMSDEKSMVAVTARACFEEVYFQRIRAFLYPLAAENDASPPPVNPSKVAIFSLEYDGFVAVPGQWKGEAKMPEEGYWHNKNSYNNIAICLNKKYLPEDARYNFKIREDFDFTLQIIASGRSTVRFTDLGFTVPQYCKRNGGMTDYYSDTSNDIKEQNEAFISKWKSVSFETLKGTLCNETLRIDVKVCWWMLQPRHYGDGKKLVVMKERSTGQRKEFDSAAEVVQWPHQLHGNAFVCVPDVLLENVSEAKAAYQQLLKKFSQKEARIRWIGANLPHKHTDFLETCTEELIDFSAELKKISGGVGKPSAAAGSAKNGAASKAVAASIKTPARSTNQKKQTATTTASKKKSVSKSATPANTAEKAAKKEKEKTPKTPKEPAVPGWKGWTMLSYRHITPEFGVSLGLEDITSSVGVGHVVHCIPEESDMPPLVKGVVTQKEPVRGQAGKFDFCVVPDRRLHRGVNTFTTRICYALPSSTTTGSEGAQGETEKETVTFEEASNIVQRALDAVEGEELAQQQAAEAEELQNAMSPMEDGSGVAPFQTEKTPAATLASSEKAAEECGNGGGNEGGEDDVACELESKRMRKEEGGEEEVSL